MHVGYDAVAHLATRDPHGPLEGQMKHDWRLPERNEDDEPAGILILGAGPDVELVVHDVRHAYISWQTA